MEGLYKNKFRIKSARLDSWDYSSNGYYFITICIKNFRCLFGGIEDDEMVLNQLGEIAVAYWIEIPQHFNNVILDEFVVMPNHVHGIIIIKNKQSRDVAMQRLYRGNYKNMSKISPQSNSLSVIIRSYKSIVVKTINQKFSHINFKWQSLFYDHIIRTEQSLYNIRNYIISNPDKWADDGNNPKVL